MVWFFHLGTEQRSCETRLATDGNGYELVIVEGDREHREPFQELVHLLSREHELLSAWRAQGWRQRVARRDYDKTPALSVGRR